MTLDMNYIRNEFAAKITANDGDKGSMDAALFHVVKIAFEQGRVAGGGDTGNCHREHTVVDEPEESDETNKDKDNDLEQAFLALFEFCEAEMGWMYFRADRLQEPKQARITEQNAETLRLHLTRYNKIPVIKKLIQEQRLSILKEQS